MCSRSAYLLVRIEIWIWNRKSSGRAKVKAVSLDVRAEQEEERGVWTDEEKREPKREREMAEQLFSPQCFICSWAPAHFFTPKSEPEPDLSWNQPRVTEERQESEYSALSPSLSLPRSPFLIQLLSDGLLEGLTKPSCSQLSHVFNHHSCWNED